MGTTGTDRIHLLSKAPSRPYGASIHCNLRGEGGIAPEWKERVSTRYSSAPTMSSAVHRTLLSQVDTLLVWRVTSVVHKVAPGGRPVAFRLEGKPDDILDGFHSGGGVQTQRHALVAAVTGI